MPYVGPKSLKTNALNVIQTSEKKHVVTWYEFYVRLIMLVEDLLIMRAGAYWALTTSSTFSQSTPKIANMALKWYYR